MDENSLNAAQPVPENTDDYANYRKLLVFAAGDSKYSVDAQNVDEIINDTEIYTLPFVPECVEGIINLRGQPVTIFNPFLPAKGAGSDVKTKPNFKHCNILKFKQSDEAFGIRISTVETFLPENKADGIEELNLEKLVTALREALGYKND